MFPKWSKSVPSNKFSQEFVRPQPGRAFIVFVAAHIVSIFVCMIYPVIMSIVEYSDERLNSAEVGNFQNFVNNLCEVFYWFQFYSLPAFLVATGLFLSKFFFDHPGFRKIAYVTTFLVIFATLRLDTGMAFPEHWLAYGTAALYVAGLFVCAAYLCRRFGIRG